MSRLPLIATLCIACLALCLTVLAQPRDHAAPPEHNPQRHPTSGESGDAGVAHGQHNPERHLDHLHHMAERIEIFRHFLNQVREFNADPELVAIAAVMSLKDDVEREPRAVAADLQELLEHTDSLPVRNTIRMTLKDIYKHTNQREPLLENLRDMVIENDRAIMASDHDEHRDDDDHPWDDDDRGHDHDDAQGH